ncbi:hypothetical protein EMPS_10697 [Entomortierella parvispora]|uniref:Uncharacterized protein n=1 Tax=Entomortierella parvispora TaxID=205924 RepID=A0A9P3M1I5_9FUNG|nr:hypothetical protein EMPS_10697 [Entomortierella parvispora]
MGSDWYTFCSTTAAAIPVPKEALKQPFDLPGFKLMTIVRETQDEYRKYEYNEYHGALICLEETELIVSSVEVIGPYEITSHQVESKRMTHLDAFMPEDVRKRLTSACEAYLGRQPDDVPGFWNVSSTKSYFVELHSTWSLGAMDTVAGEDSDLERFCYSVDRSGDDV